MLFSVSEAIRLLYGPVSYIYENFRMAVKKKLVKRRYLTQLATAVYSIIVGHGYLQHGQCVWRGFCCLCYHTYHISSRSDLKDAVGLACVRSKFCYSKRTCNRFKEKGAEQGVDRTSETNEDDKSDDG